MRTETIEIFQYNELSEAAKQHAVEHYRNHGMDHEWWDSVYEDAKEIGKILGIEIDNIYFSGFSCQSDGACFEGNYSYVAGSKKAIRDYAPQNKKLHAIADGLAAIQRKRFYQLTASVEYTGGYCHKYSTSIDTYDNRDNKFLDSFGYGPVAGIDTLFRDFMEWIYRALESEYYALTEDGAIAETIECNEWEYTSDGEIYH